MNVIKSTVFAADDDDDTNNDGNGYKDDSVVVRSVDRCRLLMPTHIDFAWFFLIEFLSPLMLYIVFKNTQPTLSHLF